MQLPRPGLGGGCASEGCISQPTSLPASDPASQAVTRPFPRVSAAWRGFNTSSVSPVRIPLHQSIPSLPEHAALSTPLEKPLGAGMGGTVGPYPASPAPRSSGRWTRAPAAGTGGTGSGGSRCSAGAWAGCNLGCGGEGLSIPASRNSHRNQAPIALLQAGISPPTQLPALWALTSGTAREFHGQSGRCAHPKPAPRRLPDHPDLSSIPFLSLHPSPAGCSLPWAWSLLGGGTSLRPPSPSPRAGPAPLGLPRGGLGVRAWAGREQRTAAQMWGLQLAPASPAAEDGEDQLSPGKGHPWDAQHPRCTAQPRLGLHRGQEDVTPRDERLKLLQPGEPPAPLPWGVTSPRATSGPFWTESLCSCNITGVVGIHPLLSCVFLLGFVPPPSFRTGLEPFQLWGVFKPLLPLRKNKRKSGSCFRQCPALPWGSPHVLPSCPPSCPPLVSLPCVLVCPSQPALPPPCPTPSFGVCTHLSGPSL